MTFSPKTSTRLSPNLTLPLKLTTLSINVATKMLIKTANNRTMIRNAKEKKAIRGYLSKNLTHLLCQDILQRTLELRGAHAVLSLLDLFEPRQGVKDIVDLVGPLSLRFGCSRAGRHQWFIRTLEKYNLTLPQLELLYNILIWSNPSELRMLALSASSDVLKASKIPSILARGRVLTKVTLLEGADNHILRILGLRCPRLKYLDISNSRNVTDQGILNLLQSTPPRQKGQIIRVKHYRNVGARKKNPCAETIDFIKFPCTSIGRLGSSAACEILDNSYLFSPNPYCMIVRITEPEGMWSKGIPYDRVRDSFPPCQGLRLEIIPLLTLLVRRIVGSWLDQPLMDHIIIPEERSTKGRHNSMLFIRRSFDPSTKIHMKMDFEKVTSLVIGRSFLSLNIIGEHFPFLKSFWGGIQGLWYTGNQPFLPNLEVISAWCLTSIAALSILQIGSSIKLCELSMYHRDTNFHYDRRLTDSTLGECLRTNRRLAESLEEITFCPCRLTVTSLDALISNCPNLKLIGDLQSWKMRSREMERYNKKLDKMNSKCVLSVMNLPPPKIQNFKWI